jgi:hypothetical protein
MAVSTTRRTQLQGILETVLGSSNVYFQPGEGRTLNYPCIVYERDNASTKHADNAPYSWQQRYQVTFVSREPDSDVIDKLYSLPLCVFNRHFATSGLNHDVFVLYH